jgi:phage terminase small subunit
MAAKKLTPKQKKFCEEYLIDCNGTQAAIRAGYSEKTAKEQATRLLTKVYVKDYIESKQKKTFDKFEITKEQIVKMVFDIANSKGERTNDRLKAFEIVNKMLGLNEAEKQDIKATLINWNETKTYDSDQEANTSD